MAVVEKSIEIDVPVSTAYNQWTQFEEFPHFMEGVERVRQLAPDRLHWVADVGGRVKEWDARIVDQTPDARIAWRSEDGAANDGVVTFHSAGSGTRVAACGGAITTCRMGRPYFTANSWSRSSWAGTAMMAPVPYSMST